MQELELYLKYMNKLKNAEQSIDIYYDNLEPEFVVKITNNLDKAQTKHFRNTKIEKALDEACEYLEKEYEKVLLS